MEQDSPSFWADIKKYEDTLERDPNSYCFAPLSELYRKLGMVDDAISIAKRGCELHPDYIGGYMALGRAYHEKGMNEECRSALEKVVRVTPDNLLAQRILSQLYIDAGEIAAAEKALNAIITQNPDDVESRMLLESLTRIAVVDKQSVVGIKEHLGGGGGSEETNLKLPDDRGEAPERGLDAEVLQFEFVEDEEEEILDLLESDIVEEPLPEVAEEEEIPYRALPEEKAPDVVHSEELERKDPLTTVTLAELYVSQGFPERALEIYRELLTTDPANEDLKSRIAAVESEIHGAAKVDEPVAPEVAYSLSETVSEPPVTVPFSFDSETGGVPSVAECQASEEQRPAGNEEQVIHALEIWLENIKRRR